MTIDTGRPAARRPDLFVVGAPKCGTTTLYHQLAAHPEIFMSRPKEPSYFAAERYRNWRMSYPEDESRYLELFAEAGDAKRIGDASTSYLEAPFAAERIRDFQPAARIVIMLRDPVTMIDSLHGMRVAQGREPYEDLAEALEDERTRPGFGVVGDQSAIRYRDRARFGAMLPAWFDTFGRERVHVMLLEDVVANAAGTFRTLLEFLDVDPRFQPDFDRRYNTGYRRRSQRVASVVKGVPPAGVPVPLRHRLVSPVVKLLNRVNRVPKQRPPVADEVREMLQRELADDVARASELLGRDLRQVWWAAPAERPTRSSSASG
jgi:hypothetical protein